MARKPTHARVVQTRPSIKPANQRVGKFGEVWYDPTTGAPRMSDGKTPGGVRVGVQVVEDLVQEKLEAYESALSMWNGFIANETRYEGHPWFNWDVSGENASNYMQELIYGWQVQVSPSSPPSSPPTSPDLIFVPAISASYYNQIRAVLSVVIGTYEAYQNALKAKEIVGDSLTVPEVLMTTVDENLNITIRYTIPSSPAGTTATVERTFTFTTSGALVFPDGTSQSSASISIAQLKNIVAFSTDFAGFKAAILSL